ncbi:MAG: aspartate aminotransferase family protein [Clostridiaceae bacterium]|nr:aspartate aminotransferase family protein [Clostridiaceae bacterium]
MINSIIQEGNKYTMNTYKRLPIAFVEGKGSYLTDTEGNQYLDMISGLGACGLGHSHSVVTKAIKEQAEKLMHVANIYWIKEQVELGKLLVENSFGDKAFFCNSGAEANEAAIKLARKYAYKKYGDHKNEIIAMTSSFHGRTIGTLGVTHNKKYQEGFGPIPKGFKFATFNDIDSLKEAITENTCGIMMEPIQGEGGVTAADPTFLKEVKAICEEMDILLIFDEIQCGIARTGKLFAYENYGIEPDIMTLAKALGSGFPIGAVIAKEEVAQAFKPGDHGTTFGGNPLACSCALATMKFIIEEKLWEQVEKTAGYFEEELKQLINRYAWVKKVKGKGLMVGLELEIEGSFIVEEAFKEGILINCTAGKVLRFLPSLVLEEKDVKKTVEVLNKIFQEVEGKQCMAI